MKSLKFATLALFGGASCLAACQTLPSDDSGRTAPIMDASDSKKPDNPGPVDLLPLLDIKTGPSRADNSANFVGGYTRLRVEAQGDSMSHLNSRRYYDERRGWERWLWGESVSRVLSIQARLSRPDISATTTLVSASQESSRSRGETWATEVHGSRMLTPFFRVEPTTTLSVEASINTSTAVQGDVTGSFIEVLGTAANLLAPSSTLVTTLTEARLDAASKFVDESLSKLFTQTISEKSANEFAPFAWTSKSLVTVSANLPLQGRTSDDRGIEPIGSWSIAFEPAIVSIFSSLPLCPNTNSGCTGGDSLSQAEKAFQGLAPYTVLNFRLDSQQTLVQAIRADEAVARALDGLARSNDAGDTEKQAAATLLCNLVASKAEALGFNRFDSAAIVWAVGFSDLVTSKDRELMMNATAANDCLSASLATTLELSSSTASQPQNNPDKTTGQQGQAQTPSAEGSAAPGSVTKPAAPTVQTSAD